MINGFGLEKFGIGALRFPIPATFLVLVVTLIAAFGLTRLEFSGDNIEILRDGSAEIENYDTLLSNFRDFNNDAIVLVRAENLATVKGIETYRELHFEFQFDERVQSVLSIFSLVTYDKNQGGWSSAVPADFENDAQVKAFLDKLAKDIPNSQSLLSPNYDSAVMVVYTKPDFIADSSVRQTMADFAKLGKSYETEGISISIAGQPSIRSGMIDAIVDDLVVLAPIAALFCALISLAIFRSLLSMVLCTVPTLLSLVWFLGGVGLFGIPLNFLTNILPVLLIVIIFADTLHLFIKWQNLETESGDGAKAMQEAVNSVGPACALSVLTTAIALGSLATSGNFGLTELGVVGAIGVVAGYFAIIVVLPLLTMWAYKRGFRPKATGASSLSKLAGPGIKLLSRYKVVMIVGLIVTMIGLWGHYTIESRFRLVDYLASQSEIAKSEGFIDQRYSGTTPLFAIVDVDKDKPLLGEENTKTFYSVLDSVAEVFENTSFYSLADFEKEVRKGGGEINESDLDELPDYLTSRFITKERDKALITIFSSANTSASDMRAQIAKLNTKLVEKGLDEKVTVTGYPILAGVVAPRLMDSLRISLLVAVVLAIGLVMVAARSWRIGLACLMPNLIPILGVELILIAAGIPLNMSITVALTVAFGIAVDDSIHLVNQYLIARKEHDNRDAVRAALIDVTPAVTSTTLILSAGLVIMIFSSLPAISVFSVVVILTLIFALISDIFLLPAALLALK